MDTFKEHIRRRLLGTRISANILMGIESLAPKGFAENWHKIAGNIYMKYVTALEETGQRPKWNDIKSNNVENLYGPRHGCVNPIGSINIYEDVAYYVGKIRVTPDFFKPLIDPSSPQYDPRYKQKIDLLLEYGFITQEQYDQVFREIPPKVAAVK